jgi:hypothetical protein
MSDNVEGLLGFALAIGAFLLWCNGIAVCIKNHEIFWAVFSFLMPPAGFVIGLWNIIF